MYPETAMREWAKQRAEWRCGEWEDMVEVPTRLVAIRRANGLGGLPRLPSCAHARTSEQGVYSAFNRR